MEDGLKQLALDAGAADVGIAPVDRLGGVPSMDASYLLPGAQAVVSVMVAFDADVTERYLGKENWRGCSGTKRSCTGGWTSSPGGSRPPCPGAATARR